MRAILPHKETVVAARSMKGSLDVQETVEDTERREEVNHVACI